MFSTIRRDDNVLLPPSMSSQLSRDKACIQDHRFVMLMCPQITDVFTIDMAPLIPISRLNQPGGMYGMFSPTLCFDYLTYLIEQFWEIDYFDLRKRTVALVSAST